MSQTPFFESATSGHKLTQGFSSGICPLIIASFLSLLSRRKPRNASAHKRSTARCWSVTKFCSEAFCMCLASAYMLFRELGLIALVKSE